MSGYLAAVAILLLLWGAVLRPVMAIVVGRLGLKPAQGVLAWLFALAPAYAALAALTVFSLPHSRLTEKWTQAELSELAHWSFYSNAAVVVLFLLWVYWRQLLPLQAVAKTQAGQAGQV